jgi:uncharacterized protein (DUF2235 family)
VPLINRWFALQQSLFRLLGDLLEKPASAMAPLNKLIVLCDGTWCGRETNTESNINYLARMVGIDMNGPGDVQTLDRPGVLARYADGVGLGSTFLDYLFDAATANDIAEKCTDAYRYIVENYTLQHEIWMFGLSRGAYTVRCVAGMINNCGIVKPRFNPDGTINKMETKVLCEEVYKIYRSPYDIDAPQSPQMVEFRQNASHHVKTPVKFMGLFDTVGELGIPRFTGGVGFNWPGFYDQNVSSVVEKVYHAVSMHDRLWIFQPCLASRNPHVLKDSNFGIEEKWFPGVHYDLGRQRFRFFRTGTNSVERILFPLLNLLSKTIEPNNVLADLVLKWMLEGINLHDPANMVIPNIVAERGTVTQRIRNGGHIGNGDVYNNALAYLPFGKIISSIYSFSTMFGSTIESILGFKSILQILLAVRDRRVPDDNAQMYHFNLPDPNLGPGAATIRQLAGLDSHRYPSWTYESFELYLLTSGVIPQATYNARVQWNR